MQCDIFIRFSTPTRALGWEDSEGLYILKPKVITSSLDAAVVKKNKGNQQDIVLWYRRLGHVSSTNLSHLQNLSVKLHILIVLKVALYDC